MSVEYGDTVCLGPKETWEQLSLPSLHVTRDRFGAIVNYGPESTPLMKVIYREAATHIRTYDETCTPSSIAYNRTEHVNVRYKGKWPQDPSGIAQLLHEVDALYTFPTMSIDYVSQTVHFHRSNGTKIPASDPLQDISPYRYDDSYFQYISHTNLGRVIVTRPTGDVTVFQFPIQPGHETPIHQFCVYSAFLPDE